MIRIGLRDARSHFGRFIMSIVAIALGVSFVVGSFCFREMLNNQVSQMMSTNADHDVYVRGSQEKKKDSSAMSMGSTKSYNDVDVDLAGTIAKVDGVSSARVVHMLSGVVLLDKHGDAVTTMGSPTLAIGMGKSSPWRSAKFTTGTWPKNGDEIALHSFAAEQSGLKVGDKTKIVYPGGAHKVTVSGIFTTDASQAGAIIIAIDPVTAKEKASKQSDDPDKTSLISVYGNKTTPLDDNAQQQLADRINKALPRSAKAHAITGDEYRDESTKSTQDALGFIQPLILIFAVIALFVGSFIIANTFSMIVRESMRGYALLRSIGASPLQVFSTVIVQALLLGLVGSLAGIGLGWGMSNSSHPVWRIWVSPSTGKTTVSKFPASSFHTRKETLLLSAPATGYLNPAYRGYTSCGSSYSPEDEQNICMGYSCTPLSSVRTKASARLSGDHAINRV